MNDRRHDGGDVSRIEVLEAEVERLRAVLAVVANYDVRVTQGATDAYRIQDIARTAIGWDESLLPEGPPDG